MVLGVVLHAALIYKSGSEWLVSDPGRSAVFGYIYEGVHAFRMPAFFIISGLLTERVLRKGPGRFVRDRFVRLGVPLLTTALVLNSAQSLLVFGPGAGLTVAWDEYAGGRWVGHLWFLVYLMVYCCVAAGLSAMAVGRLTRTPRLYAGAAVVLMPAVSGGLRWVGDAYLNDAGLTLGMLDARDLITYAPYFAFGLIYRPGADPTSLRRLAVWSVPLLAYSAASPLDHVEGMSLYTDAGVAWAASLLCLYAGSKVLARPSGVVRRIADASYTVYLVHHFAVVALGLALITLPIPASVKFTLVVVGAFAFSVWVHERWVGRYPVLAFALNGRPMRRVAPTATVTVPSTVFAARVTVSGGQNLSPDPAPTAPSIRQP